MSASTRTGETPEQLTEIGALPIPDPNMLDDDLKKYMAICEEKLGHIPNVVKVFSLRPAKLRTFIAKYNEMMLSDDPGLSRLEREMIAVIVSCVKSRGSSAASDVNMMLPLPRLATSFSRAASTSWSVPSPMTLTVMSDTAHFLSSAL